jgi:hypothetical protein
MILILLPNSIATKVLTDYETMSIAQFKEYFICNWK